MLITNTWWVDPGRWAAKWAVSSSANRNYFQRCKSGRRVVGAPKGMVSTRRTRRRWQHVHCPSLLLLRLLAVTHELRHREISSRECLIDVLYCNIMGNRSAFKDLKIPEYKLFDIFQKPRCISASNFYITTLTHQQIVDTNIIET